MGTLLTFIVCWTIAIFAGLAIWVWAKHRDAVRGGRR